ncbi:RICIN domain-containing protein [Microbispora sp. RL4-1S]|uniref:RICIN domain-containing protein n=1 Tax=Microbispora oryzae TaxID=2806554 RepID=A0A941ALG7_9ACTN|nr:RICIN domain-containing protein [Microbispora oryzae]MBP2708595.1 RICIN domain-containing protein [Microbispora oryzae]
MPIKRYAVTLAVITLAALVPTVDAGAASTAGSAVTRAVTRAAAPPRAIPTSGTFSLYNWKSSLCLGINARGGAGQWPCTGKSDQTWHWGAYQPADSGYRQLVNGANQCLGVMGASTAEGTQLNAAECAGASRPEQYWWVNPVAPITGGHALTVWNYKTDAVIAVSGGSLSNGAPVVQYHCICSSDQYWYGQ